MKDVKYGKDVKDLKKVTSKIRKIEEHSSFATPLLVSLPHSGEQIPPEFPELAELPASIKFADVDRFVDELYEPSLRSLGIPFVVTPWHRYCGDLNRTPDEVDQSSVVGAPHPAGTHPHGFFWVKTMQQELLMAQPRSRQVWKKMTRELFDPFHDYLEEVYAKIRQEGHSQILHLDLHSMPSVGTSEHRDPGELRAEVVISDCQGRSASPQFMELVCECFSATGFKVRKNWPYLGGKITQTYGKPSLGRHAIQIELNRSLYMDEVTKDKKPESFCRLQEKLSVALRGVLNSLKSMRCERS